MMSTAILLKTGADHPAIKLASADLDVPEGASFAESLDENLGDGVSSQGKTALEKPATGLWGRKSAEAATRPDQVAQALDGVGKKGAAGQRGRELAGAKNAIAEKIAEPRATIVMDSPSKALLGKPAAKDGVSVQEELGGPAPGRDNLPHVQTGGLKDGALLQVVPLVGAGKDDSPVVGGGSSAVLSKETKAEPAGKTDEVASAKKPVRSPESGVPPKTAPKNITLVASGSAIQQRLNTATPPEGGATPSGIAAATVAVTRDEGGATTKVLGEVSSVSIPSTATTSAASAGPVRYEVAHGVKRGVPDVETAVTPVDASIASPNAPPKTSMGLSPQATLPSVGSDGDGKTQSGQLSTPGLPHVMSGGVETLSSSNPSVPLHLSAQGDLIAAKSQVGEAAPPSAGLPSGMREQGDLVGVGASIGEVPKMLTATPTSLEVGVQNGMHGWLKIRAELTEGGVVNASVSTASSTGQEMLHRELPALAAYLVEEKVAVNAVVVHASPATGANVGGSSGMDGAGGQASQRSNDGEEREQNLGRAALSDSSEPMTYRNLQGVDEDGSLPFAGYGSSGGWLSVRA